MIEALQDIFATPYLWQALGMVTALSMFISPVLFNGDYKAAIKSTVVVGGYATFVGLLNYFHLAVREGVGLQSWLQPILVLGFVGIAYTLGLIIGVGIHNRTHKHKK